MSSYHFHDEDGTTYTEHELEELYRNMLSDVYGVVTICGLEYDAAHALESIDPVAFRCDLADFRSEYMECFECHLNAA